MFLSYAKRKITGKKLLCIFSSVLSLGFVQAQSPATASGDGAASQAAAPSPIRIAGHQAKYDAHGQLLPWTSWGDAIDREMEWYLRCPWENGYPRFVQITFMGGDYGPSRRDTIPAMQNGMGIISYLKYYHWKKEPDPRVLKTARAMGDFLIKETLTPDTGAYPRFTRSTGWRSQLPLLADSGSQADRPYEVEPDKAGIAGYALMLLYEETKDSRYLEQALQNARVLARNKINGDDTHSPWPFRVDYRTGEARGPISSDMSYILRLFDKLIAHGYTEFDKPRTELWTRIRTVQIPNVDKPNLKDGGALWVQFFEDYDLAGNRNSWAPLNMARYLVEQREALDPNWKPDAKMLIDFAIRNFTTVRFGVLACGEQDDDKDPWGGASSTFGGVLAQYAAATGDTEYKGLAWQALTLALYATDEDGSPRASVLKPSRGGWQEDAHTDKIHNFIDALEAFPEWAR